MDMRLSQRKDFTQVHMNLIHGHDKMLLNFWDPDLIFKVTLEKTSKLRPKTFKCTFSFEWFNGLYPNLHDLKPRHDKSRCGFCDLDLIIQGKIGKKVKFRVNLIKWALSSERVSGYFLNLDEINI